MPTISVFYGIIVQMYWADHGPPHFHALYAEHEVVIDIQTLAVRQGTMPPRALQLIREWAIQHRTELLEDWALCTRRQPLRKIPPLP